MANTDQISRDHSRRDKTKRIRVERTASPVDDLDADRFPTDDADNPLLAHRRAGLRPARETLPLAALLEGLGKAGLRRLRASGGIALVVEVPSADWAEPIDRALAGLTLIDQAIVRTGATRSEVTSFQTDRCAAVLSEGQRLVGISQSPARYLPEILVAQADLHVRICPPSNRSIAEAIRAATGRRPRRLPARVAAGLGYETLTAAIRLGDTPAACLRRLEAAAAAAGADAASDAAPLDTLVGYGRAMDWANALVRDLDAWRGGRLPWSEISRACCLSGPPGVGKTTLVRSIARDAGLPLVSTSVAEFFTSSSGYLDGVLKALDKVVARANTQAPCILFLDETDAIPNRSTIDNRGREWWTTAINGILMTIDSIVSGPNSRIILIGATNHAKHLDPAMVRPGRLHPVIEVEPPSVQDLAAILRARLGTDLPDTDLTHVARHAAPGATGADAVAWVRGARSLARDAGRRVEPGDLLAQVAPADDRTPEEIQACARHEAAHAVAAAVLDVGDVRSVSIVMAGPAAGSTWTSLHRVIATRARCEALAIVALAGRAIDAACGLANTGAGGGHHSDLARATDIVAALHSSFGLSSTLVHRGAPGDAVRAAMRADAGLREIVERDLQALYAKAVMLVADYRPAIDEIAERLTAERVLPGEEIGRIVGRHGGGRDAR